MRGVVMRIGAMSVLAVLLAAISGWGAVIQPQVGEAVPDEVAVAQTGGCPNWACQKLQGFNCRTRPGTNCIRTLVFASDTTGSNWRPPTCSVWCGQNNGDCLEYAPYGNVTPCGPGG
jgi:hypothetical protein